MSDTEESGEEWLLDGDPGPARVFGLCCVCIPTGSVGVVQQLGRYIGFLEPGMSCYCPPFHSVRNISLALSQTNCKTQCKTKDNVTLTIKTVVTHRVNKNRIKMAVFGILDPISQIKAQVDNIVRSSLPAMDLDDAYANKEQLCADILTAISSSMGKYGYDIVNVLVTDLAPEESVLQAMNAINAARRSREAAAEQAEGNKIIQVKAAEADAEAKFLSGRGIARMRKAMADGNKESLTSMAASGLSPQESMNLMVTTQYLDTLKDFANNPNKSAIMVPPAPSSGVESEVRNGMLQANALSLGAAPPQVAMRR